MSKSNGRDSGIPRPYASTDLPTPRRVIEEIFSPLSVWIVLLLLVGVSAVSVGLLALFTSFGYNSGPIIVGSGFAVIGMLLHADEPSRSDVRSVPSIENVCRTKEYITMSSRIAVVSLLAGVFSMFVLVGIHTLDNISINSITRLAVVVSILLGYVSSYVIVRTLCSYTPLHENSKLSLPVDVSSAPEIVTLLGFILPPLLVVYTAFMYRRPPWIKIPFELTVIDAFAVCLGIYVLYFALISRL